MDSPFGTHYISSRIVQMSGNSPAAFPFPIQFIPSTVEVFILFKGDVLLRIFFTSACTSMYVCIFCSRMDNETPGQKKFVSLQKNSGKMFAWLQGYVFGECKDLMIWPILDCNI